MDNSTNLIETIADAFCVGRDEDVKRYLRSTLQNLVLLAKNEKEIELLNKRLEQTA